MYYTCVLYVLFVLYNRAIASFILHRSVHNTKNMYYLYLFVLYNQAIASCLYPGHPRLVCAARSVEALASGLLTHRSQK